MVGIPAHNLDREMAPIMAVFRIQLRRGREFSFDAENPLIQSHIWQVEANGSHVVVCSVADDIAFLEYLQDSPAVETFSRFDPGPGG